MTIDEALKIYKRPIELARALGIHRQSITRWKKRGYIPAKHQLKIQELTNEKLKACSVDILLKDGEKNK
jgi:hypothetical protein